MSLYEELKDTNFPYSPTVVRDLIDSNFKRYGYVRPLTKRIIFFMMRRIVLRGVATFLNINRNRSNDTVYDTEDMVAEIYFVLDKCVEKFDTRLKSDFYLYFSSAVSNRVRRMSNYKNINNDEISFTKYGSQVSDDNEILVEELLEDRKVSNDGEGEFLAYVESIDWTEEEAGVLESLRNERCVRDAMRENGMSRQEYEDTMESIREKLMHNDIMDEVMMKLSEIWTQNR